MSASSESAKYTQDNSDELARLRREVADLRERLEGCANMSRSILKARREGRYGAIDDLAENIEILATD